MRHWILISVIETEKNMNLSELTTRLLIPQMQFIVYLKIDK